MFFFFFFSSRRRHTRLQGDWSSDVCSSDLILELSRRVEFGARIVKAVTDFVTDGCADRAVVCSGIGLRVEIRRLEDRGREVECVLERQVDRIHGLRRHPPFARVDWLLKLAELVSI